MSGLRSVVDALRSEVLAELPDARIEEDFAELQAVMNQLEVEDDRAVFRRPDGSVLEDRAPP